MNFTIFSATHRQHLHTMAVFTVVLQMSMAAKCGVPCRPTSCHCPTIRAQRLEQGFLFPIQAYAQHTPWGQQVKLLMLLQTVFNNMLAIDTRSQASVAALMCLGAW